VQTFCGSWYNAKANRNVIRGVLTRCVLSQCEVPHHNTT